MPADPFDYALPPELIAQYPPSSRRAARLLAVGSGVDACRDLSIGDLPALLRAGDLVVLNDTRVIPARLFGRKDSGGALEILIERVLDERRALAQMRASKAPRAGTRCLLEPDGELVVRGREDDLFVLEVVGDMSFAALLERCGHVPLPPYIARADTSIDAERYQTVFAAKPGAVAAPTAGLHFDQDLLSELEAAGVTFAFVTLHVGAGTFRPVRDADLDAHVMHAEAVDVPAAVCDAVGAARARGGRVVAVGTTVTRALETAAQASGSLEPFRGETRLFIRPGFEFRVVDALLTNFHLPRSTLLMLVSAFAGHTPVMAAYAHAIRHGYRFFSYGDAMWLERTHAPAVREGDA